MKLGLKHLVVPLILIPLVVSLSGCDGQVYPPNGRHGPASSISDRGYWQVSGDLDGLSNAVDGEISTVAVSRFEYRNAQLTIDLGRPCFFNMVVIDHGSSASKGYCRRVALLTSSDGRIFTLRHSVGGTRRMTILNMITPVLARYVRLQAVVPGEEPWAVAEVYVH